MRICESVCWLQQIKDFIQAYDENPDATLPDRLSTHFACSMIVKYFMGITKIGRPIWGDTKEEAETFKDQFDEINQMEQKGFKKEAKVAKMRALLESLPRANYATWKMITELLYHACKPQYAETNKMEAVHFAMCVMPQIKWGFMIDNYPGLFENSEKDSQRRPGAPTGQEKGATTAAHVTNPHNPSIKSIRGIGKSPEPESAAEPVSPTGAGPAAYREYVRHTQQGGRASSGPELPPQPARHTTTSALII